MASITSFPSGRMFQFVVEKRLTTNPARTWVNNYKSISISAGALSDLITMGRNIAAFELYFHSQQSFFTKWRVSTAAHDSATYNPDSFYEEGIGLAGQYSRGTDFLSLDVAWWVDKLVQTGRQGRQLYRGILTEGDVNAPAGAFTGAGPETALGIRLTDGVTQFLARYLSNGSSTILRLCLYGPNGEVPRVVSSLLPHGIMTAKTNHRYFDRKNIVAHPPITDASSLPDDFDAPLPVDWEAMLNP